MAALYQMTHPADSPARRGPAAPRRALATPRAVLALILREMSTTYGRSPGGYLWAVLEPAAGVALLTLIFSAGFRSPPLGTSFVLFYAAGLLPFLMYSDIALKVGQTIRFSRALLVYPRVTFLDALLARLLLAAFTQLMVCFLVLGAVMLTLRGDTVLDLARLAQACLLAIALAAGVGTLNAFLVLAYPLWETIWAITTRPLFLISGVFFLFEAVPEPWAGYLWFNPLVHVVGVMRSGVYPFYPAAYASPAYVTLVALGTLLAGLLLLQRYHRDILDC